VGVVLLLAGGLTLLPPPAGAGNTYAQIGGEMGHDLGPVPSPQPTQPPDLPPEPAVAGLELRGYRLDFEAVPSTEGDLFTLTVTRALPEAPPLDDVSKVLIRVTPQDIDAGTSSYTAEPTGAGAASWRVREQILTLAGDYLVTAVLQRTRESDLRAAFRLEFSEEGALKAAAAELVDLRLSTDPTPPQVGTNRVTVTLLGAEGSAIEGARVAVTARQTSSANTGSGQAAGPVAGQPGAYAADLEFNGAGPWLLFFVVERDGQKSFKTDASIEVVGDAAPSSNP